ncbi:hypothetical protein LguiB_000515 [Lonicera macranthoides]
MYVRVHAHGTLRQHLFDGKKIGFPPLSWNQRVTIALDVARGIEYLHSLAQQSFIHRDLKPSNILLGDKARAKVSDFSLVKNSPNGKAMPCIEPTDDDFEFCKELEELQAFRFSKVNSRGRREIS